VLKVCQPCTCLAAHEDCHSYQIEEDLTVDRSTKQVSKFWLAQWHLAPWSYRLSYHASTISPTLIVCNFRHAYECLRQQNDHFNH
jgi:hypothetical protein